MMEVRSYTLVNKKPVYENLSWKISELARKELLSFVYQGNQFEGPWIVHTRSHSTAIISRHLFPVTIHGEERSFSDDEMILGALVGGKLNLQERLLSSATI